MARQTREQAVRALLETRDDWLPALPIWTGTLKAAPGPAASTHVPCDTCSASGRTRHGEPCIVCRDARRAGKPIKRPWHGCQPCPTCNGHRTRRRRAGDEQYDSYLDKPLALAREQAQREEAERFNARSAISARTETNDIGGYRWERAKAAMSVRGDYEHLERAIAKLDERDRELINRFTAHKTDNAFRFNGIDIVVRRIATLMPAHIRAPRYNPRQAPAANAEQR